MGDRSLVRESLAVRGRVVRLLPPFEAWAYIGLSFQSEKTLGPWEDVEFERWRNGIVKGSS